MKKIPQITLSIAIIIVTLSACSSGEARRTLGLGKRSPDEFMVLSHPPLSVPPEFNLREPGAAGVDKDSNIDAETKKVLFKAESQNTGPKSRGEVSLLKGAATTDASPNIRELLAQDNAPPEPIEEEKGFFESLVDPIIPNKPDPVIDVAKEEERLEKNQKEGKPATEGETPTLDPPAKSILDKIF